MEEQIQYIYDYFNIVVTASVLLIVALVVSSVIAIIWLSTYAQENHDKQLIERIKKEIK